MTAEVVSIEKIPSPAEVDGMVPAELVERARRMRDEALSYVIRSHADAQRANTMAEQMRNDRLMIEAIYAQPTAAAHALHRGLTGARAAMCAPLDEGERALNDGLLGWQKKVRQRQQEIAAQQAADERRRLAAAAETALQQLEQQAQRAESGGDPVTAGELRAISQEPPVEMKVPASAPAPASSLKVIAPNTSTRREWKIDEARAARPGTSEIRADVVKGVIQFVAANPLFSSLLTIDLGEAAAWAKRLGHDDGSTDFPQQLIDAGLVPVYSESLARRRK